ncbi:exopolysaccharide biosynthesis protein [Ligilactobacillus saerimneri]|uniref:tyrosine-protein phosphatase n=1 Tax=Ligilactobacillus saerimneri TaxID=228229 RepID=UPI0022A7FB93|nr:CpsB/CapC family capsule biosynthesis tyrosine phosphatase [Ligilactobacillus saerimneri]MCZ0891362.1 exopolysaccharide biosynthesis protein [Ligilactobacillus saerimneri]
MGLIDLHCHLLPGLDDGSPDLETSLQLARDAVNDGVSHAVVTPHHLNGRYVNHRADVIKATEDFQAALEAAGIPLTIFAGQEVRLSDRVIPALDANDILFADADGRYMLLEFPSSEVPHYAKNMIFSLQQRGITPIIVHPERNKEILHKPELLGDFLQSGCLTQLTASSYLGTFGKEIEDVTTRFIAAGQGTILASDAHALSHREYELGAGIAKLEKQFGPDVAAQYQANAKALVNGDLVQMHWQPLRKKRKFLGLF